MQSCQENESLFIQVTFICSPFKITAIKSKIHTTAAPTPGGKYSQAIKSGNLVFLSGQLPMNATTGVIEMDDPHEMYRICFRNLAAICAAAGGHLNQIVKLQVYYTDICYASFLDEVIPEFFQEPYPARIRLVVKEISKKAKVEIDGIMDLEIESGI
ncbi:RidA family protein [Chitinophaga nivalis]|uniref:RidA family protein n=1 Tax=Chitinophaga nivalis TaxID=2991709 RepID=A0ABT3IK93_9BACT|nr:RidA family protein [Chitinophaga nivalis]MCW3465922.1 RidA family protein [Chitinophaga nivalis]MCW3484387.1 RidA family protein [Chitinophaga nivalis]